MAACAGYSPWGRPRRIRGGHDGGRTVSGTVTFDGAPPPGTINFGVGQPSADLLPVALLEEASRAFFATARPEDLNYGALQGDERFRDALAAFLGREYGQPVDAGSLVLSGGNSQALDFCCARLLTPGDVVFVEEPSYFLAFRIFADHAARVVGIPVDADGLDLQRLEDALARSRPKLVYTIPSFANPGGQTLAADRRRALVELASRHGFTIVADEVYQSLWCESPPPPALGTHCESDVVLSLGSFSKILAPGLRLGWIQAGPGLRRHLLAAGVLNSGGNFNHVTSHLVREVLNSGRLDEHVARLRATYGRRIETMDGALRAEVDDLATWRRPAGGYFFWLRLAGARDATALRARAAEFGTGFQPGPLFTRGGGMRDRLRLSFAHYAEADIREGVARLAALLRGA